MDGVEVTVTPTLDEESFAEELREIGDAFHATADEIEAACDRNTDDADGD